MTIPPSRIRRCLGALLRSGGGIAFSTWCGPEVDGAFGNVFGAIGTHGSPEIVLPLGPGAADYADPDIAYPVLKAAGFGEFRCDLVASCWQVDDPGLAFDFFREGRARGGALLPPVAVVKRVRENHGEGPEWTVPIPSVVISARAVLAGQDQRRRLISSSATLELRQALHRQSVSASPKRRIVLMSEPPTRLISHS